MIKMEIKSQSGGDLGSAGRADPLFIDTADTLLVCLEFSWRLRLLCYCCSPSQPNSGPGHADPRIHA